MSTTLAREPLTTLLLDQLASATTLTVGDGELPDGQANWIGQPNLPGSNFAPFPVLSALFTSESFGAIGESQGSWKLPYLIESFGVLRAQCEWCADKCRTGLDALRGTVHTLGADRYKVAYVKTDAIGSPARIDVVDPPFWHQQDRITVWIGRARS